MQGLGVTMPQRNQTLRGCNLLIIVRQIFMLSYPLDKSY